MAKIRKKDFREALAVLKPATGRIAEELDPAIKVAGDSIVSYDGETVVCADIGAGVDGDVLFDAKALSAIASGEGYVEFEGDSVADDDIRIGALSEHGIEYPVFDECAEVATLNGSIVADTAKHLLSSFATNSARYELNGWLIDVRNKEVRLVGTDTRIMTAVDAGWADESVERKMIVPRGALSALSVALKYNPVDVIVLYTCSANSSAFVKIDVGRFTIYSKLIAGEYPDYRRIIDGSSDTITARGTILDVKDFAKKLKKVAKISDLVELNAKDEKIVIRGHNGKVSAKVDAVVDTYGNIDVQISVFGKAIDGLCGKIDFSWNDAKVIRLNKDYVKTATMGVVL